MTLRIIDKIIHGIDTSDGAGVNLKRIIGNPELNMLDPFLLLDEFGVRFSLFILFAMDAIVMELRLYQITLYCCFILNILLLFCKEHVTIIFICMYIYCFVFLNYIATTR